MALNLSKIVSGAVKTASKLTVSLQAIVTWKAWTGNDQRGKNTYATYSIRALVEQEVKTQIDQSTGQAIQTQAKITILDPLPVVAALSGFWRTNPVDNRDILILPDGTTGPAYRPGGFVNPDTNKPFLMEVWMGSQGR
jgi:hypothetical protein